MTAERPIRESFLHHDLQFGAEGSFIVREQGDSSCKYYHTLWFGHMYELRELSPFEFIEGNSDRYLIDEKEGLRLKARVSVRCMVAKPSATKEMETTVTTEWKTGPTTFSVWHKVGQEVKPIGEMITVGYPRSGDLTADIQRNKSKR